VPPASSPARSGALSPQTRPGAPDRGPDGPGDPGAPVWGQVALALAQAEGAWVTLAPLRRRHPLLSAEALPLVLGDHYAQTQTFFSLLLLSRLGRTSSRARRRARPPFARRQPPRNTIRE